MTDDAAARKLGAGAGQDLRRDRIPLGCRLIDERSEARNRPPMKIAVVDFVDQLRRTRQSHVAQHQVRQLCCWAASVELPDHRCQRCTPDPEAAAFVANQVAPSAGAGGLAGAIPAIRNRPGTRDDDDPRLIGRSCFESDERVVDDERSRLVADPIHDAADGVGIRRPIDAGNTEADRGRSDVMVRQRGFHDGVQHFLDFELPYRLQVCSAVACFGNDMALRVREQTDGFGPSRVDSQNVHALLW